MKAIIFDMDGVLIDSETFRFARLKELFSSHDKTLSDDQKSVVIGNRTSLALQKLLGDTKDAQQIAQEYYIHKHAHPESYYALMPYVPECLAYLQSNHFKLAIGTGSRSDEIKELIDIFHFRDTFCVTVGHDQVKRGKPFPDIYELCVTLLDIPKEECLVIEDSPIGVRAAKAAGLKVVAVTYTHSQEQLHLADYVIESLAELPDVLATHF